MTTCSVNMKRDDQDKDKLTSNKQELLPCKNCKTCSQVKSNR